MGSKLMFKKAYKNIGKHKSFLCGLEMIRNPERQRAAEIRLKEDISHEKITGKDRCSL